MTKQRFEIIIEIAATISLIRTLEFVIGTKPVLLKSDKAQICSWDSSQKEADNSNLVIRGGSFSGSANRNSIIKTSIRHKNRLELTGKRGLLNL